MDGGFCCWVTHDSSFVSELTFDETLEVTVDSLEHVVVPESTV